MKNKLLKGGHLSEKKCREILQLFSDDLTATQIAEISGISRVTVNNYFKLIRSIIANFCERNNEMRNIIYGTYPDGVSESNSSGVSSYYGFYVEKGKVGTSWLKDFCDSSLAKLKTNKNAVTNETPESLPGYHAVADCNDWKLHWVHKNQDASSLHEADIAGFWTHTKGRLQKFRGLNRNTLYLHIKECEFRYNFRHDDLLPILSDIINNKKRLQPDVPGKYEHVYTRAVL